MKSVLFLIPTLDRGGAENVLVDLVNNLDQEKFQITVQTLFDKDAQKDRLRSGIRYRTFLYKQFRGNSRLMARIPAKFLYRHIVKERYDIVVSYLEGPTTHILAGCPYQDTKKAAWIHVQMETPRQLSAGFRSLEEAVEAYRTFDRVVFVAESVRQSCEKVSGVSFENSAVLYNTVESDEIRRKAGEAVTDLVFDSAEFNIVSVGRIISAKGFDRLLSAHKRLIEHGRRCHVYILGTGAEESRLRQAAEADGLSDSFTFLGFRENPYKYVEKADLFVCSSRREGFSTAVTEALVLGVPVVSTDCSGARELLGEHDEYGIVTGSSEEELYQGIKRLLDDPALLAHYREMARERGKQFSKETTVRAVEEMLSALLEENS